MSNLFATKSGLAKILAVENLQVIHDSSAKTASFDLKGRTVVLPVLKNMEGFMYDAFIAHEISHALYTPPTGWEKIISDKKIPAGYVNVTEDARIERLIQKRYPGTKRDFSLFYKELSQPSRDFFKINGKNLKDLSLINRINLHFKIGHEVKIPFEQEELQFVQMCEELLTWDDAVFAAQKIFEYVKEQKKKEKKQEQDQKKSYKKTSGNESPSEESAPKDKGDTVEEEEEKSDKDSSEGKSDSEGSEDSEDDSDNSSDMSDDSDKDSDDSEDFQESSGNSDNDLEDSEDDSEGESSLESYSDDTSTQNDFDNNFLKSEITSSSKSSAFATIPDFSQKYKDHVTSLDHMVKHIGNIPTKNSDYARHYVKFITQIAPTINMMVNQFNMKKAAVSYNKTQISNSGDLNENKLALYQLKNDIFKKNEIYHEEKNHGMVMMLDWSGSMSGNILSTLKQLIVLMEFCKKVNIPFEVYGFTTTAETETTTPEIMGIQSGEIFADKGGVIFHLFSSSLRHFEYDALIKKVFYLATVGTCGEIQKMNYTNLHHVAFISEYLINEFKQKHKKEKNIFVLLSDGGATDSLNVKNWNIIMRSPKTNKNYCFENIHYNTVDQVLRYVKEVTGVSKTVGFFISSKFVDSHLKYKIKPSEEDKIKYNDDFRHKGCASLKGLLAFNQYFVVNINKFSLDNADYLSGVSKYTSSGVIFKKMEKELQKYSMSLPFMKIFVDDIST